jgi:hypothetical protein
MAISSFVKLFKRIALIPTICGQIARIRAKQKAGHAGKRNTKIPYDLMSGISGDSLLAYFSLHGPAARYVIILLIAANPAVFYRS